MTSEATSVLINLCWLVPGVVGGSEEATTGAIRALLESDQPDLDLRLAVLRPFLDVHPDLAAAIPCDVLPADGGNKVLRVAAEQLWLARLASRLGVDVVHHAGGVVPLVHPSRVVLTIHDLQPLDMPQNFSWKKRAYLRMMLGRSARVADVVCVPSRFTASRVEDLLGVPDERIVEVPWSLKPDSLIGSDRLQSDLPHSDLPHSDLPHGGLPQDDPPDPQYRTPGRRFLLYPAIAYPHKRHLMLIEAFAALTATEPEVDLLLTGSPGPLHGEVQAAIKRLGLSERVRHLGRVSAEQLDDLYRHAEAVVLPSAYEGFGMPALEAMGRNCPVLSSDSGSLSEVVPPRSLVSGDDARSWTEAMKSVLSLTEQQRAEWIRIGAEAAGKFTPERTASALAGAYRLANRGQSRPKVP
ncbi:MAG: glycosyltransferase family 1 protein [Microthrixaceae bacterium]